MRSALASVEHGRRLWFDSNHLDVRVLLLQVLACTTNGTACSYSCNKNIHLAIGITPDFGACSGIVLGRIGSILELLEDNAAWSIVTQFLCCTNSSRHTILAWCQYHLGTVSLHKVATLDAHRLRHGEDELIAFDSADESETYASITACRFDDGGSWLQEALLLSVLNHGECDAVLDAATWIKELYFGNDGSINAFFLRKLVKLHKWSIAYEIGQLFHYFCHIFYV